MRVNFTLLEGYGIDGAEGLKRCAGSEAIYKKLLFAFLRDGSMPRAAQAYGEKDREGMFAALHELKGACGNAAMPVLYGAVSRLVDMLRGGECEWEAVDKPFAEAVTAYDSAREGVIRFLD